MTRKPLRIQVEINVISKVRMRLLPNTPKRTAALLVATNTAIYPTCNAVFNQLYQELTP